MVVGRYSLDLYCDGAACPLGPREVPATYTAQLGSRCRRDARRDGWKLSADLTQAYCPHCSGATRRRIARPGSTPASRPA